MRNPFRAIVEKLKELKGKVPPLPHDEKPRDKKEYVDNVGDSFLIGGIAIIGIAAFTPATGAALVTGAIFVAAGGTAKYAAWKMKPNGPDLSTALPPASPAKPEGKAAPQRKPAGPGFNQAADKAQPGDRPEAPKAPPAPRAEPPAL
jgi:hypothetical protein